MLEDVQTETRRGRRPRTRLPPSSTCRDARSSGTATATSALAGPASNHRSPLEGMRAAAEMAGSSAGVKQMREESGLPHT